MLPASASIQGPLSIGSPQGDSGRLSKFMNVHLQSLVRYCCHLRSLRHFGRTKRDVPIARTPQVADPELRLEHLKKVACGSGRDGRSCRKKLGWKLLSGGKSGRSLPPCLHRREHRGSAHQPDCGADNLGRPGESKIVFDHSVGPDRHLAWIG